MQIPRTGIEMIFLVRMLDKGIENVPIRPNSGIQGRPPVAAIRRFENFAVAGTQKNRVGPARIEQQRSGAGASSIPSLSRHSRPDFPLE